MNNLCYVYVSTVVELLSHLSPEQCQKVADAVQIIHYTKGERVIKKGDPGSIFYMIKEGSATCTELGTAGHEQDDMVWHSI